MKILALAIIIILTGCTSPYSKFYVDTSGGIDFKSSVIKTENIEVRQGGNQDVDDRSMRENGSDLVGYSAFNASNVSEDGAITKAKEVNASVVLLYCHYTGTQSGFTPITLPSTATSSTILNGNVYNQVTGLTPYNGLANTTYNGPSTAYLPFTVENYDYRATYWIKKAPSNVGK